MLSIPAPFPQVGSYALLDRDGRRHLVRVQKRNPGGILVAFPFTPEVASGNCTVAESDLIDGTPLDDKEKAELERLEAEILRLSQAKPGGRPGPSHRAKLRRADALRKRALNAEALAFLVAKLPVPGRSASVLGEAA
jgi:hypothetical protein